MHISCFKLNLRFRTSFCLSGSVLLGSVPVCSADTNTLVYTFPLEAPPPQRRFNPSSPFPICLFACKLVILLKGRHIGEVIKVGKTKYSQEAKQTDLSAKQKESLKLKYLPTESKHAVYRLKYHFKVLKKHFVSEINIARYC